MKRSRKENYTGQTGHFVVDRPGSVGLATPRKVNGLAGSEGNRGGKFCCFDINLLLGHGDYKGM